MLTRERNIFLLVPLRYGRSTRNPTMNVAVIAEVMLSGVEV